MNKTEQIVRESFLEQAGLCEKFGSPFTAHLIYALNDVLDHSTEIGRAVLDWEGPPAATGDALALRLAGALHGLARSGRSQALTAIYPPNPSVPGNALRDCLSDAIGDHDSFLVPWLQFAPQTNDVGRSAVLYAGLMEITRRTGLPLSLLEIGSSAGLNLMLDRYRYDFGGKMFGAAESALTLTPEWLGPIPEQSTPEIVARRGCDLSPLQIANPEYRRRLEAYVWPDQQERYQRLAAAIEILLAEPPEVDAADATDWVRQRIVEERPEKTATVLMHSLTVSYLPEPAKAMLREHMERVGSRASASRPLAWLAFELDQANQTLLTLKLWPSGEETVLAEAHPHCRYIKWVGASS